MMNRSRRVIHGAAASPYKRREASDPVCNPCSSYQRQCLQAMEHLVQRPIRESLVNKAKVTMRKTYGFRTFKITELVLYHVLGKIPEPKLTHSFY